MDTSRYDFFAASNSGKGFINYFPDIFNNQKNIIIIKGGPGTGKSSMMKSFLKKAKEKGYNAECFYCSSDPSSLDGIIIPELGLGLCDGTAPHTFEAVLPGIRDRIVDLGAFWNSGILEKQRKRINELSERKSKLFKNVYDALAAALSIKKVGKRLSEAHFDSNICRSYLTEISDRVDSVHGEKRIRLISGITMEGEKSFDTYENEALSIYRIKDEYMLASEVFDIIDTHLADKERVVSYDPLDPSEINMIYLPCQRLLFTRNRSEDLPTISTEMFVKSNGKAERRAEVKQAYELMKKNLDYAVEILGDIRKTHFELEEIYIGAMDFAAKEDYENKLISELIP